MPRRVRLITEWATWKPQAKAGYGHMSYRLCGEKDYAAFVYAANDKWYCVVYKESIYNPGWRYFAEDDTLPQYATREEACAACEERLAQHGLIDPLWWVTQ